MSNPLETGITRREFLKKTFIASAGTVAVMETEAAFRPVGFLLGTLSRFLGLQDGNPLQVYAVYSRLASRAYLNPSHPENLQDLEAFMAPYSALNLLTDASKVTPVTVPAEISLRRFLFAKKSRLPQDMTREVLAGISAEYIFPIGSDPNSNFLLDVLQPSRFIPGMVKFRGDKLHLVGSADSSKFVFQSTFGHVGINISGEVQKTASGILLARPQFSLFDRFDFAVNTPNPPTGQVADTVKSIAKTLHLPLETLIKLIPDPLKLSRSARLLQVRGLAHPFDITAGVYQCHDSVYLPSSLLS
jgi:hypothetical protein